MDLLPPSQTASTDIQLNEWLFEIIQPYLKGRVLEAGSGFHTISAVFINKGRRLHLSTPDKALREQLRARYQGIEAVRKVHSINFHRSDFDLAYRLEQANMFDTILILSPMQNSEFDARVIGNVRHLLRERGYLILLAPVFTAIYSGFDLDFDELKRCDRPTIKHLLTDKMTILTTRYFQLPKNSVYDRSGPSVIIVARKNKTD